MCDHGDAQLLVLLRQAYVHLMDMFPEQHQIIVDNIVMHHAVDRNGNDVSMQARIAIVRAIVQCTCIRNIPPHDDRTMWRLTTRILTASDNDNR